MAQVIAKQTRAWLRRQDSVWGLTTRTLTHIGPSDVPATVVNYFITDS